MKLDEDWRKSHRWKAVKKQCLVIHDYECYCCGKKYSFLSKRKLDVHHVFDASNNPSRAFDVHNLVPLCSKTCHKKYHRWMGGTKVATDKKSLEQFIEFYNRKNGFDSNPILISFLLAVLFWALSEASK
jgi:hypothetical protein